MRNKNFFLRASLSVFGLGILFSLGLFSIMGMSLNSAPFAVGDPIPEISCTNGMTATIYTEGLGSPDGLAFDTNGLMHVSEETAGALSDGKITEVETNGVQTDLLTGLVRPEGIAFDAANNLYYVDDDINNGGVYKRSPAGVVTTIAGSDVITSPEGIAIGADGTIYVTASDAEKAASNPPTTREEANDHKTYIYAFAATAPYTQTVLLEIGPEIPDPATLPPSEISDIIANGYTVDQPSFSGISIGPDGKLYVASESSGVEDSQVIPVPNPFFPIGPATINITVTAVSTRSVFVVDPVNPPSPNTVAPAPFVENLTVPEGLRFQNGAFPLLVVEEGTTGADSGRLISVNAAGAATELCTGFGSLEDVITDADGNIYVTDDSVGHNRVVKLTAPPATATPTATATGTPTATPSATVNGTATAQASATAAANATATAQAQASATAAANATATAQASATAAANATATAQAPGEPNLILYLPMVLR